MLISNPLPNGSPTSAISAIARLTQAGFTVAVATNQSGIARGFYDEATLNTMNERLHGLVEAEGGQIAHIAYCPHGPMISAAAVNRFLGYLPRYRTN